MEVVQVLHMNGGVGEASYYNNSLIQKKVISMTKTIREEAITKLYSTSFPTKLVIADLGCSSGPNTLIVVSEFIKIVSNICKKLGNQSPEFQLFLNDLPGNDFNTVFRSLPTVQEKLRKVMGYGGGPCFFTGVPGSFYGRLFPSKSVDIFHSSYSLQWLSQVPEGLQCNRGNIYMASRSPACVLKAYYQQFQKDFSLFLKCRSEELAAAGGRMVLTFLGRRSDDPSSKECCYIWELLAVALNEMASEGIIDENKVDSFNIPQYTPSPSEIKCEVMKEGSFGIDRIEVTEVNWNAYSDEYDEGDALQLQDGGYNVAQYMRAVAEPLLVSHFGEEIIDEVFNKYRKIIADRMDKEKTEFINVTISLTKRG